MLRHTTTSKRGYIFGHLQETIIKFQSLTIHIEHKSGADRHTITAVIIHQYDFLQQPSWCLVNDAADGPFDHRKSFIQVDQHNADGGKILWVLLFSTPEKWCWSFRFLHVVHKDFSVFYWMKYCRCNFLQGFMMTFQCLSVLYKIVANQIKSNREKTQILMIYCRVAHCTRCGLFVLSNSHLGDLVSEISLFRGNLSLRKAL